MQWGYYKATSGSYTVTFPIAFSRQTCAVCVTNVNSGAGYPVTYTPNTSSIKITNKCYENFWIAVGFQQWGKTTTRSDTVTFPIAYTNTLFGIYSQKAANGTTTINISIYKETLTGFAFNVSIPQSQFQSFRQHYWLSVGMQQQWGRSTAATLNFSLPFQKFYCITTAQESWDSATFDNTSWITRTNISVTWPTYLDTNINYIAVGIQAKPKLCQKRTS